MKRTRTPSLEDAIKLAVKAHHGQKDKAGMPYIFHPLRLASNLRTEREKIVAILHDVIEDTPYQMDDLHREGYPPPVLTALDCLTRHQDESYDGFLVRVQRNPLARRVKIADLEDNLDITRLSRLTHADVIRLCKYQKAWHILTADKARRK